MAIFILVSVLGCIAGIVGILKDLPTGNRTMQDLLIAIALALILIATFGYNIYDHYQTLKKEKYTKTWGNFNFPTDVARQPAFFVGRYQLNSLVLGDDKWETWFEDGRVKLRGVIRDRERNIVFQIDGTDWKNWTGKDFNYDDKGIEVKDSKGNIIFQLEFDKQENKVTIYGIFYYGPNNLVLVGKEENINVVLTDPAAESLVNAFIRSTKPMFRYPRESHFGERVEIHDSQKENILRHPLFVAIVSGLAIAIILWAGKRWVLPVIQQHQIYCQKQNIAFSIYPEVLGNVNKINSYIYKIDSGKAVELKDIKFSTELYKMHYTAGIFDVPELDKQLANFYNNLNSIDVLFKKVDFERIKAQGESVIKMLGDNYGCQDYDKVFNLVNRDNVVTAASADTVAVSGSIATWDLEKKK